MTLSAFLRPCLALLEVSDITLLKSLFPNDRSIAVGDNSSAGKRRSLREQQWDSADSECRVLRVHSRKRLTTHPSVPQPQRLPPNRTGGSVVDFFSKQSLRFWKLRTKKAKNYQRKKKQIKRSIIRRLFGITVRCLPISCTLSSICYSSIRNPFYVGGKLHYAVFYL